MKSGVLDVVRIGIFYDGYYFYKVSNYYKYEHEKKSRISIGGLHDFIRNEVADIASLDIRQCQIIDAHYFKGRSSARDLGEKVQSERIFEDILMRENIVTHYLPLRMNENNTLQEKGIDVWLALEAYELSIYKHFDILVLVAGDGDYLPLIRKLHTIGTQTLLICWDFSYHNDSGEIQETKTSRQLMDEVFYPVQMHQKIEQNNNEYVKQLFVPEKTYEKTPLLFSGDPLYGKTKLSFEPGEDDEPAEEIVSTILTIHPNGFGFIRDEEHNNVFFHYSVVANRDFTELEQGMRVRYVREQDEQRSKKEEGPRFRAVKVAILD